MSEAELAADKGAFFGSILGTLNHIAVADTIWLHRFAQHRATFTAFVDLPAIPKPTSLRDVISTDLESLREYRSRLDNMIVAWVAELKAEHLAFDLMYTNMAGATSSKNFGYLLLHFFNHQTHHRGQVSTLLFQASVDPGVTDLITLIPNSDA